MYVASDLSLNVIISTLEQLLTHPIIMQWTVLYYWYKTKLIIVISYRWLSLTFLLAVYHFLKILIGCYLHWLLASQYQSVCHYLLCLPVSSAFHWLQLYPRQCLSFNDKCFQCINFCSKLKLLYVQVNVTLFHVRYDEEKF